ncbi:hypothetical protein I546_5544 [Mycobacterium kansasii 732]|nr:hypothetical protein I546_5544 [Mycobacterium kansasii 732]
MTAFPSLLSVDSDMPDRIHRAGIGVGSFDSDFVSCSAHR